ncbi:DNA-directed RNA polymerase subunit beta [Nocardia sp. NPDC058176]|uniref:DNA-directed RNA polymerase subunit beta n=1 Tax=Nocardia sp. NPDC058176 TaxID=3346368 RepID=UPI0036D86756
MEEDAALQSSRYYRMTCGLPALVHPTYTDMVVVKTGSVIGITMPSSLGAEVIREMRDQESAVGAIVGHHRSGRWTFIVRADLTTDDSDHIALFAELYRLDVWVVRDGAEIALPISPSDVFRHWVEEPRDKFRPAASVVVSAVRRVREKSNAP